MHVECQSCSAPLAQIDPRTALRAVALRCSCGETLRLDNRLDPATRTRNLTPRVADIPADGDADARLRALNAALDDAERAARRAADRASALRTQRDAVASGIADETLKIHAALRAAGFNPDKLGMSPAQMRDLFISLSKIGG